MSYFKFENRHIGPNLSEVKEMLSTIEMKSIDELIEKTIPSSIRLTDDLNLPEAMSEHEYLNHVKELANKNEVFRSYIGQGYYGTVIPSPILRNILENPGWYTAYTPYQAEISQGRLEALLNFQTVVSDLTGMEIANASLLDEGTAVAETMLMFYSLRTRQQQKNNVNKFFISENCFQQTLKVVETRAKALDIELIIGNYKNIEVDETFFGAMFQYPDKNGEIENYKETISNLQQKEIKVGFAADILALAILTPPGEWNADVVVGNTQRFGVPMGFGGPHAAYFATKEEYKRAIPGRIIGVSKDKYGKTAYRMALQTREQHIKRERATSNICTAQALLAVMAGMYAVYHGPQGIKGIASRVYSLTTYLRQQLENAGFEILNKNHFDTLSIRIDNENQHTNIQNRANALGINFNYFDEGVIRVSLDETTLISDLEDVLEVVIGNKLKIEDVKEVEVKEDLNRTSEYLSHQVFNMYHTETKLMRYIKKLENRDLSLVHSMISLGSCTMKLNAASQLIPITWDNFANIHPFAPLSQTEGYNEMLKSLADYLSTITGFYKTSLQPNSGSQGEYAGLLTIKAYHQSKGEGHRNIVLIPSSAHGTNPASAVMAGMKVVVVKCDEKGNIELGDLKEKAEKNKDNLAALMVTYPSTHGVFEEEIIQVTKITHENGGQVYMDGANMNAQVGYTNPFNIGADVCHLNLHKTFAIPHGGGGPGMGPICVAEHLAPFLPSESLEANNENSKAISAAPFGSALILLISYGYIRMLGKNGLKKSTEIAILNANYIKKRLSEGYDILYQGVNNTVAHELIVDCRNFKKTTKVEVNDIAKRLIDYGFHAPTVSFPVAGTLMIEPTESESKDELDRFCDAMLKIREEIDKIEKGEYLLDNNPLVNSPHTMYDMLNEWDFPYPRSEASFPMSYIEDFKYWTNINRIDNAYGDRNLICSCPSIEMYNNEKILVK